MCCQEKCTDIFLSHKKPYHICVKFQCPVCPKKTGKVQNFKDHIKRHLVALGQGGNAESNAASSVKTPQFLSAPTRHRQCPFCRNEMLSTELSQVSIIKVVLIFITYQGLNIPKFSKKNVGPVRLLFLSFLLQCPYLLSQPLSFCLLLPSQHITESHSNEVVYACDQCDAKFAKESKLITHREKHLPKNQWKFGCILCDLVFPTQPRLKLHNVNSHASLGLQVSFLMMTV